MALNCWNTASKFQMYCKSVGSPGAFLLFVFIVWLLFFLNSTFCKYTVFAFQVNGTIVLFRPVWQDYWSYVTYRSAGPSRAAKLGALASLVRSATPFSLYTPHTGMVSYEKDVPRIPAAAVTVEDADLIARIVQRGNHAAHSYGVNLKVFPAAPTFHICPSLNCWRLRNIMSCSWQAHIFMPSRSISTKLN